MNSDQIRELARKLNSNPAGASVFAPEMEVPTPSAPVEAQQEAPAPAVAPTPAAPTKPLSQDTIQKLVFLRLLQHQNEGEGR